MIQVLTRNQTHDLSDSDIYVLRYETYCKSTVQAVRKSDST